MRIGCGGAWVLVAVITGSPWVVMREAAAASPSSAPAPGESRAVSRPADSQPVPPAPLTITQAECIRSAFNPSIGQTGEVRFLLSREAAVSITAFGPNQEEVARVMEGKSFPAGWHTVSWNGRDRDGGVVPNEAYVLTIQATAGQESTVFDPFLNSGGERIIAAEVKPLEDGRRLSYQLPRNCRVLIRAAVVEGPLLRTLVNWEPRGVGLCLEHWDGRDADGLRRILDVANARIAVMAFALPNLTLITTGNTETSYRDYYRARAKDWPRKPPVVRSGLGEDVISPHALLPPHLNRDPRITISFPEIEEDGRADSAKLAPASLPSSLPATQPSSRPADERVTVLSSDSVLFRVEVPDAADRDFLNEQKFELIVYVDDRRVIEVEQGHVPFTYPWNVAALPPGRHVLTVNVASFRNHVGTASRLVDIRR